MTRYGGRAAGNRAPRIAAVAALAVAMAAAAAGMMAAGGAAFAQQQASSAGFGGSPFERDFGDVKFLDAYFGTPDQKIEVEPGDSSVPFTVVFANVGTQDITGIRGQLSLPYGFSPSAGHGPIIRADSATNSEAGDSFSLTFFVNVGGGTGIGQYPAAVKVDYSRLRESGTRTAFANFDFAVTGDAVINTRASDPFLTSLRVNEVTMQVANDGTAPLAGVEVTAANTQTERVSTAASTTNVENVVLSESSWDLGQIGPGSAAEISTDVYVPETLRGETLRIPLEISYYNAHGDRIVVSKIVDFFVKGLIELSVFNVGVVDISGAPMIIGEIINEGNEDGLFGFVSISPRGGGSNIVPVSQFIDEIEVDAPVPFNIPAEFEGEPAYGSHDIRIEVRYKDSIREEHVLVHDATIRVPEPPPPERGPFDLVGAAGVGGGGSGATAGGAMPVQIDNTLAAAAIGVVAATLAAAWLVVARRRRRLRQPGDSGGDAPGGGSDYGPDFGDAASAAAPGAAKDGAQPSRTA